MLRELPVKSSSFYLLMQGLSFQAGLVNVIGYEMTSRFASHVTGAVTFYGIEYADASIGVTVTPAVVPGSFLSQIRMDTIYQRTCVGWVNGKEAFIFSARVLKFFCRSRESG